MLHYILQTIAFQLFFLIIYDVFLKKETFFNWNRAYLLLTSALSVVLPFIKVDQFKEVVPQQYIINLPEVFLGKLDNVNSSLVSEVIINDASRFVFSWQLLFFVGAIIAFTLLTYKLIKIAMLIYKSPKRWQGDLRIVKLINSNAAFSFFYYVFLGDSIKPEDKDAVLKHETIHVNQKHTIDLLLFELLRIGFWFNPLIYMYQNRITTLHEYIADARAVKSQNKKQYYENLLTQVFETENVSFINSFFKQSLIKKRIIMLSKAKSNQILKLKYALLVPMLFGMLLYTSCEKEVDAKAKTKSELFSDSSTEILKQIDALKESIAAKGEMTEEEQKALKTLMMLVTDNGLNEPFYQDVLDRAEIPFGVIENVPVYPGCESLTTNAERRKCMANEISKLVQKNFNVDLADGLGLEGRQRINVVFKINKEGEIEDIKSRAPHPELEKEAVRIISLLPKMKPGSHKGKNVIVPYSLPIIFEVKESSTK